MRFAGTFILAVITNFIFGQHNMPPQGDTSQNNNKKWYWHPIAGSTPETGWQIGGGFVHIIKKVDTAGQASFINGHLFISIKKYWACNINSRYLNQGERYLFQTDVSYINLPLYFYGIGNEVDPGHKELYQSKSFKVQFIAHRAIVKNLFLGIGYQLGSIHDVHIPENGILHSLNLYGIKGHRFSGPVMALLFDSRNNMLASTSGWFARLSKGFCMGSLGSTYEFNTLTLDIRTFIKPFKRKEDVLAFQFLGISTTGEVPFTEMALLGGQQIMRGYYTGQYRDKNFLAFQTEYRFPINHWLGLAGFAGVGAVMPELFAINGNVKPSYGSGLRFKLPSLKDLTLRIDYARGQETGNFYIGLREAF